jgi:hypothetical protein
MMFAKLCRQSSQGYKIASTQRRDERWGIGSGDHRGANSDFAFKVIGI